jgi:hypothetical protein
MEEWKNGRVEAVPFKALKDVMGLEGVRSLGAGKPMGTMFISGGSKGPQPSKPTFERHLQQSFSGRDGLCLRQGFGGHVRAVPNSIS